MKLTKTYLMLALLLISVLACGCGKNHADSIVGTWVNDKDSITFSSDGRFTAFYYFMDGKWEEFEAGKFNLLQELSGSEKYFYEITDGGILILTNAVKMEDNTWAKGGISYRFVREGKDTSILNNSSKANDSFSTNEDLEKNLEVTKVEVADELVGKDTSILNDSSKTDETVSANMDSEKNQEVSMIEDTDKLEEPTNASQTEQSTYSEETALQFVKNYLKKVEHIDIDMDENMWIGSEMENNVLYFEVWAANEDGDHAMVWGDGNIDLTSAAGYYDNRTIDGPTDVLFSLYE